MCRQKVQKHKSTLSILLTSCLAINSLLSSFTSVYSYPTTVRIDKKSGKCIKFKYPEMNLLDFIFIATPYDIADIIKDYYSRIEQYGNNDSEGLPTEMPENHVKIMKGFDRSGESPGSIRVQLHSSLSEHFQRSKTLLSKALTFHTPIIETGVDHQSGSICFSNMSKERIRILFDIVAVEVEYVEEDDHVERLTRKIIQKDSHITPVEESIQKIIKKATKITRDMDTLDKMEKRMRKTADGTNKRVRIFGYLSIILLLLTSLFQMFYLKNFFKKKKVI